MKRISIMTTIPKNRKKLIEDIFKNGKNGISYSLSNGFDGTKVDLKWIKKELYAFKFSKLRYKGGGRYEVHVHSNQWYTFTSDVVGAGKE